jgi:thiol-disulfide isomerase/thioredoxin
MFRRILAALAAVVVLALPVRADGLGIGDDAPKLGVKEFVKGDAVKEFEKGKIYVVEFWATWCGPCIQSIPHLTELQKKHKDAVFIGVSVFENEPDRVKPFVEKMGDKMAYRVAMDDVPEGSKPNDGKMAQAWMTAAGQSGIPTAFIVNGDGKVAWIGHPMSMDKPLAQVVEGKWDLKAAAEQHKKDMALRKKLIELRGKIIAAQKEGDAKAVLAVLDEAIKDDPALEKLLATQKFQLLAEAGDPAKTLEYGKKLTGDVFKDNAQGLNFVAWAILDPDGKVKADAALKALALEAAKKADELAEGKDGGIADTLAKAYFDNGDVAKALEHQERAVKLAEGTPLARDKGLQERLEQYRKAAEKK